MNTRQSLRIVLLLLLLLAPVQTQAAERHRRLWLVVTRPMFVDALQPLVEARKAGNLITKVTTTGVEKAISESKLTPRYLLIVGDDDPNEPDAEWRVPSKQLELYRWEARQRRRFASDAYYADRDGDLVPDIAIGRIPARTVEEVETCVRKILEYEKRRPTIHDLDLPVWSGSPMYGETVDTMANSLLLSTLQARRADWMSPWVLMADTRQPFCGWPADQPENFMRRMREGGLLHIFIGHGQPTSIYAMHFNNDWIRLTTKSNFDTFSQGPATSPMVLLTCSAGRFDGPEISLAEKLLFLPGGPVATIAASTQSHPLPNYFTGRELLSALKRHRYRLGDAWLSAQRRATKARNPLIESVLMEVEGKLDAEIDVAKLRRDQALMYSILGDPATKLRLPGDLDVILRREGDGWRWRVTPPGGASRLDISIRPTTVQLPASATPPTDRNIANTALDTANRCFAFEPLVTLNADEPWEGVIRKTGDIRFVASGGEYPHVHVETLEAPTGETDQSADR
ncbi:MAG TPA: C25 family cysteine peptidase [Phycisphaerae bacterium]|nr:C25 family cysteine peptidase [Phycisphaerae bacterium]HRW55068.1 C25 family cysteine peptidase [Phycisphaerae bacterium]